MKALIAVLALAALAGCRNAPVQPRIKPDLHLVSSLPLLFGEQFSLEAEQFGVVTFLENRYRLVPVDVPSQLPPGGTLLAIQPRALPAEELVALDAWVRDGGRLLLMADPSLTWHSERPLGDRLRPLPMFADTGLLGHWGLRLDAPEREGPVEANGVTFVSPGRLVKSGGDCTVDRQGLVARCRIGNGRAIVVADADWLQEVLTTGNQPPFSSHMAALQTLIDAVRR